MTVRFKHDLDAADRGNDEHATGQGREVIVQLCVVFEFAEKTPKFSTEGTA